MPCIPHFLYTDHTHLANIFYPLFKHENLLSDAWIACEKSIYRNASLNFTMSTNIRQSIIDQYDCSPDKVVNVYCGSNVSIVDKELPDSRYSDQNILFVGVDWERKGGPVLAEAFKRVLVQFPNAKLTIVGCNPELDLPNCSVIGRVPLADVGQYFQQASIFCLPTRLEPFGIVFLEAMSYKLPIIATNIGAIPDFVSYWCKWLFSGT